MNSRNHLTTQGIVISLLTCILALGTVSCASKESAEDTKNPGENTNIEQAVNDPDPISIEIPDGWVDNSNAYRDSEFTEFNMIDLDGKGSGLWATRYSPEYLTGASDGEPFTTDVWSQRNEDLRVTSSEEANSDRKAIPNRTIDGIVAAGKQYTDTEDGTKYKIQAWYVLRHDGMWKIVVRSEGNSSNIPKELLNAIDTIRWTPSGDGTKAE